LLGGEATPPSPPADASQSGVEAPPPPEFAGAPASSSSVEGQPFPVATDVDTRTADAAHDGLVLVSRSLPGDPAVVSGGAQEISTDPSDTADLTDVDWADLIASVLGDVAEDAGRGAAEACDEDSPVTDAGEASDVVGLSAAVLDAVLHGTDADVPDFSIDPGPLAIDASWPDAERSAPAEPCEPVAAKTSSSEGVLGSEPPAESITTPAGVRMSAPAEQSVAEEAPSSEVTSEPTVPDAYSAFVAALVAVALDAGATRAAASLPALLESGSLDVHAFTDDVQRALLSANVLERRADQLVPKSSFLETAKAWRQVLRGEINDLSACGTTTLDAWSADLLRAFGVGQGKDVRRELRFRGVAAFGMLLAA